MASAGTDRFMHALRTDRVWQLMALNLLVFLVLHLLAWCGVSDRALAAATALPAASAEALIHPWTALTYMFTQWDFFHLVFNMMWLWTFGLLLTRLLVPGRAIVSAYLAGGLLAAVVWVTLGAAVRNNGILIGSSAAVLSVVAYGGIVLGKRSVQLMMLGWVQVRWLALGVVILCLLTDGTTQGAVTLAVHSSGAIAGMLLALWQRRRAPRSTSKHQSFKTEFTAEDEAALDAILDKVRTGGYGALSAAEKQRLFSLSSRISRPK